MKDIVKQLNQWAYEYYVLDAPTVTDTQYDALYDQLVLLEKQTGIVLPDSPTRRVGGEILSKFVQHTHLAKLYSLDKAQTYGQLRDWIDKINKNYGRTEFTVELKYDGLNVNVTYDKGEFVRATTRGNGVTGEDITAQVRTINSVPLTIAYKGKIELDGEGIIKLSALKRYNERHPNDTLKNARNAVAGALRNLDTSITRERNPSLVFHTNGYNEEQIFHSETQFEEFLKANRFKTSDVFEIAYTFEDVKAVIERIGQERATYDFLIDGVVIKVNDYALREQMGYTEKFPRWAIAFKFEADQVATKLLGVDWQVGRTGKLTPLARLEPVELCGATIRNATLNNYGDILRKNLSIGSLVYIRRSNDVIPEVLGLAESYNNSRSIELPKICPVCGTPLIERGANLFCPNDDGCTTQIVQRITHFAEKSGCDIEGLSDKTVEQMVSKLGLRSITELYELDEQLLSQLDGFKDKKIKKLLESIAKSKQVALPNFIYALGIDNVGIVTARDFAKTFGSIDKLSNATVDELLAINDVGEIIANGVVEYFADSFNIEQIAKLKSIGINPIYQETKTGVFGGMKIVLTGSIGIPRSQAQKIIEQEGGEVASSVSKSVNLVIVGEDAGSKLAQAQKLGIKTINEEEFKKILGIL